MKNFLFVLGISMLIFACGGGGSGSGSTSTGGGGGGGGGGSSTVTVSCASGALCAPDTLNAIPTK